MLGCYVFVKCAHSHASGSYWCPLRPQ